MCRPSTSIRSTCNYMVLNAEQRSDELPVNERAAEAVQKDDGVARAAEVAPGELHFPGSHSEVSRAVRQGAGDGNTSKRPGASYPSR
jgi:hypothetical protein